MDGFNSGMEMTKEIIRDLEDRVTEITQFKQEEKKKKPGGRQDQSLRACETGPEPQGLTLKSQEERRQEVGQKKY